MNPDNIPDNEETIAYDQEISREKEVHGDQWNSVHSGYFSAPEIADPLLQVIESVITETYPDTIVDLGGGTGFLLKKLIDRGIDKRINLVNLDLSKTQLSVINNSRIEPVIESNTDFRRDELGDVDNTYLFISRSTFHYVGEDGLEPLLCNIRHQMHPGEVIIHQTASFEHVKDALCLNRLYNYMRTHKWYPTYTVCRDILEKTGFKVSSIIPAPTLTLTASSLAYRYNLNEGVIRQIRKALLKEFGEKPGVYQLTPEAFTAYLHYYIYTCTAV